MNRTKIPWCDWTWNPIVGCSPASVGCENCYAKRISRRHAANPTLPAHVREAHAKALTPDRKEWATSPCLTLLPERLNAPFWVRKPGRVFVCSMADLGHPKVPPEWHSLVWRMMRLAPWHTYILLTKRPGEWMSEAPVGTWLGVTVENETAQWRLMRLKEVAHYAWYVRFVSVEPMLGPVSFASHVVRPDWVIAGPETGPKARRCDDAWIEKLAAESPCFFDKREGRRRRREWPEGKMVRVEDAQ